MAPLISDTVLQFIRAHTNDPNGELLTDAQIEQAALRRAIYYYREPAIPMDGVNYLRWSCRGGWLDFSCEDFEGNTITPLEADAINGEFVFETPQTSGVYLTGHAAPLFAVVSDLWLLIASTRADAFQTMVGSSLESPQQAYEHALQQSKHYLALAFPPGGYRRGRAYE